MPLETTLALSVPSAKGKMLKVTVNAVEVAVVTVPTAPLLNVTTLLAAVLENPVPFITMVGALIAKLAVLVVIVGGATRVATWTGVPVGVPLLPPKEFTTAVRWLRNGCVANVRVKEVAVAEVTRPVPLLKVTVLLSGVFALNPVPVMVRVVAFIPRLVVVLVTVGAATILAT